MAGFALPFARNRRNVESGAMIQRIKTAIASVGSQAVWSGGTFVLNLMLIRWLDASAYAIFVILNTLTYFLSGLMVARKVTPSTLSDRSDTVDYLRRSYGAIVRRVLSGAELIAFSILAVIVVQVFVYTTQTTAILHLGWLTLVASIAVPLTAAGTAIKELCMRFSFITSNQHHLLIANILALLFGGGIAALWAYAWGNDSVEIGIVTLGAASIFCAGWLLWQLRIKSNTPTRTEPLDEYEATVARSGAISHIVFSIRTQAYVYMIPSAVGLAAVAELNASRLSTAISSTIIPVLSQYATAFLIKRRNASGVVKVPSSYCLAASVGVALLCAATFLFMEEFVPGIVEKFANGLQLASLWTLFVAVTATRAILESEVLLNAPRAQSRGNVAGCVGAVAVFYPLTWMFGAAGAVLSLIVSELLVLTWYIVSRRGEKRP